MFEELNSALEDFLIGGIKGNPSEERLAAVLGLINKLEDVCEGYSLDCVLLASGQLFQTALKCASPHFIERVDPHEPDRVDAALDVIDDWKFGSEEE